MGISYSFMFMQLAYIFTIGAFIVLLIFLIALSYKGMKALDIYIENNRNRDKS